MTQDGLSDHGAGGAEAVALVLDMLAHMVRHPAQGGPEVMELDRFWHPRFNWYGPAGIGTRGACAASGPGTRSRSSAACPTAVRMPTHKPPLLRRRRLRRRHRLAQHAPHAHRAQLAGLPPTGQTLFLRSLDFWRVEGGRIRENWVLVDLLDAMAQVSVDPLARMREFNKARPASIPTPEKPP